MYKNIFKGDTMARGNNKDVVKAFLGDDTEFKGVLSFEGTVRVDGSFEGEIETNDNLIVGEKAVVRAEVKVGTVLIQGLVEGNISAVKKVHIASTGKLVGNITTPSLIVEEGAKVEGFVSMLGDEAKNLRVVPGKEGSGEVKSIKSGKPESPAVNG